MMQFRHVALKIVATALADALRPPDASPPSKWAPANLIVPDGPRAGQAFDLTMTPYLVEPLDMLGPDSATCEIAAMKSAQTGFTTMLIALLGFIIDRAPCRVLVIQPTSDAAAEFNRSKLDPIIRASAALRRKVASQTSRSAEGSTSYSKRFPGGSITLAISTSAADLRSKTVKVLLRDEIDQYPDDLDGQGDPLEISDGRLISFLASGDWRKADISTPTIKGRRKSSGATNRAIKDAGTCRAPPAATNSFLSGVRISVTSRAFRTRPSMSRRAAAGSSSRIKSSKWRARGAGSPAHRGRARSRPTISTRSPRHSCRGTRSPRPMSTPATIRRG